jgi:hypothetical protein
MMRQAPHRKNVACSVSAALPKRGIAMRQYVTIPFHHGVRCHCISAVYLALGSLPLVRSSD